MIAAGRRRALRRTLLAVVAPLVALAAIEGALRIAGFPRPYEGLGVRISIPPGANAGLILPDSDLLTRLAPRSTQLGGYRLNSLGLNGPEVAPHPPPETVRIVCLGDSCTFGIGAGPGNDFPRLLGATLAFAFGEGRVEVVNAGVPTYSSTQSVAQFRRDLLPLRPSIVVAYLGAQNDFQTADRTDAEAIRIRSSLAGRLLFGSSLVRAIRTILPARSAPLSDGKCTPRVPLPEFRANLESLVRDCADRRLPLLLVVPPHSEAKRQAQPECEGYEGAVRDVGARRGVPLLDPAPVFESFEGYPLWAEEVHLDRRGYRVIAAMIHEALVAHPEFAAPFEAAGLGATREIQAHHPPGLPAFDRRVGRALAALAEGRRETGRALLEEVLAADPDEVVALGRLAVLRFEDGDASGAEELLLRAVRVESDLVEAWAQLAELARLRGDETAALERLDSGLARRPHHFASLVSRARIRLARDDRRGALEDLGVAFQLAPGNSEAQRLLARARGDGPREIR